MRLPQHVVAGIVEGVTSLAGPDGWDLYLHGSRTRDNERGGDIDLLLLSDTNRLELLKAQRRKILVAIEKRIGERRVDLLVAPRDADEQTEFVQTVLPEAVKLK